MTSSAAAEPGQTARAVDTLREGQLLLESFLSTMQQLLEIVERETALVRKGWLAQAATLNAQKSELSGRYLAATLRLRASAAFLGRHFPNELRALMVRHESFRALLAINLTVLATAHAIAESIVRSAADELSRQTAPRGYGAAGQLVEPGPKSAQPLALSRTA